MKSNPNSIRLPYIFAITLLVTIFVPNLSSYAQGFNDNEWIFGYCGGNTDNNYLSFGKGENPTVQTIPGSIVFSSNNTALAIDPITGQTLFVTNGELVYDFSQQQIQGSAPGLNGNIDGTQEVATGFLEYDPNGNKLFYIFYTSLGGDLQYAVVDMNAAGQATGNERPLGEITSKNNSIGNASGALLVVKTPASPSYLISFDNGNLISRRLEDTEGDFTTTATQSLPFTPERIIFDEEQGKLILLPEDTSELITVMDFDTSTGTFSNATLITTIPGSGDYGGAEFSPDGNYIYYSVGNELFRVPSSDLAATPEEVPISLPGTPPTELHAIHDIKIGPDGSLYYLYEEVDGGPQLMGKVENPSEADLTLLEIEEDPFAGTDFCGTVFPTFAPNADIAPTVDFTWDPLEPCANNPVQLTSQITPENYRPVSFTWNFDPPLTDSLGNELPADYEQEHFLIPADATSGQSVNVTLDVTFADGTTQSENYNITLTVNNLEANFSPGDTTLCESCIDLEPLLTAQNQGGDGEGGAPGIGGGQGGQGGGQGGQGGDTEYEYFWSNKRDQGWIGKEENEVCKPGLYWVLVREPGSSCYAYAEIRVKMWDVEDQTNNIWYFGDGAGLDFNPDPDDPDAPTPRPIETPHPQDIPAGTTTISSQDGEVLFFTDGQSVWDLNGDLMQNGEDIGGENGSSQGVIAVPVPQEETLFYLFTNQTSANGQNEAKYSLVDIKSENETGVGNVVTKDNFLFSPSTEHSAALDAGDTTWVMYHELGNNTFRAYPVSGQGIGAPVFSSVGSNHGFNSGVGAMKFNSDGDQLAVTISEGGCNKLEIFDFDSDTGEMTEYARIDLGCDGEVYGMEFSEDGERIMVSYRNGGPGIEEYIIKANDNDDPDAAVCPTCFDGATDRSAIEACIISTQNQISDTQGLDLGALQIGPNGQVYAAVVGDNRIGQINVGSGCNSESSFTLDGVEPMPGTSNLGLPSFVQNSGSSIPEPSLAAPERICLDPVEGGGAMLEGGGEPDIDSYFWTITNQDDGTVIRNDYGGPGEEFQNLDQPFDAAGTYLIELRVDRCGDPEYFRESTEIQVDEPPVLTLADDATLCAGSPVTLTAIEGYDPAEGLYDFEWTNAAGQVFGDENSNEITVDEESIYSVTVSYRLPDGLSDDEALLYQTCPSTKEVFVGPAFQFELNQDAEEVCYEEVAVNFAPDTPISGEWFYELNEDGNRVSLGEFFELELWVNTLPGPGEYDIYFLAEDPILPGCTIEKTAELLVNELPLFAAAQTTPATDCNTADGSFEVTMQGMAETLTVLETGDVFTNVLPGNSVAVTGLLPGVYSIEAESSTGCFYTGSVTVENSNPPAGFEYTVSTADETCSATGVAPGTITIDFITPPVDGSYNLVRQGDGAVFTNTFTGETQLVIPVPHGDYSVEILDPAGCPIPDPDLYTIEQKNQVTYSAPTDFTACGSYTFTPASPENLVYTLRDQAGNLVSPDANGAYTISQSGTYTILGEDPSGINCPREISLNANITTSIDFDVSPPIIDCQVGVVYEAILNNISPAEVNFLWKDDQGIIVGRRQTFVPSSDGDYTLEVQPIAGGLCPVDKKAFTAVTISQNIQVALDVVPFCVDQTSTTITIDAAMTDVDEIAWFNVVGTTATRIPAFDGMPIIQVDQEGTYQVRLYSATCEIGRASGVVIKSTIEAPVVPEEITICAIEGVTQTISPGVYDNYEWRLDSTLISTDSTYTPTEAGLYELTVSDNVGCEYVTTVNVIEDCSLKITFPNGVVLGDPDRNFILYANEYIDDVEVFIFNRWGELIFYCQHDNLEPNQSFCPWDGQVGGEFVQNGTYAVVVKFTSEDQNKTEQLTKAITVIQ
ncbi:gliding motility-associated C-terminal domain-containing protein [Algoriphagus halophytocola]|uniref:Gliding motility-associated C-terminal domain-containing protein n=1 Tax=Algoriphagus halophytocola TaxID=2991499 RepID=A0ABY6MN66_9BACT|nr:gliding motility-associated C-terminal domain-containing protein [Algoriphagus sp. TR-M5]UZD24449.1 gliding motility-associated C-terminal domain-containing protein [Algoriphagus sp. TR-M5]